MARAGGGWLERLAFRDWRAVTALFASSTLLEALALGHLTAFTPLFLRDELGLPQDEIGPWTGLLTAATFAVAFPLAPLWGSLAERYSRKLIIVRSQYIEAVAYGLTAIAPDLAWLFAARIILGFTLGNVAIIIATQTLLTPDRRMASSISVVQAANPVAISLGPPVGALLVPIIGLRGLMGIDALACLLAAVLVTLFMPEPPGRDRRIRVLTNIRSSLAMVVRRPVLRWNFLSWYLTRGAMGIIDTYLPVRIAELAPTSPAPAIGLVLGIYGVLTTIATGLTGRLVDRVRPATLFWPAMALATVTAMATALSPLLWAVALATWIRSVPVALTGTVLYAHLAQVVSRQERAPVMSLTPVPRNFAQFSLPLLAAAAANVSTAAALLVGAGAYLVATAVGWLLKQKTPPQLSR